MREQVLTTANVNAAQFGKLFSRAVDGPIYALPLLVTQLHVRRERVRATSSLWLQSRTAFTPSTPTTPRNRSPIGT